MPILAKIRAWLDEQMKLVLPRSPMALAMQYTLNQWEALCRYTEHGWLKIDNNAAERAMKRVAIERNYAECMIMRSGVIADWPIGWLSRVLAAQTGFLN